MTVTSPEKRKIAPTQVNEARLIKYNGLFGRNNRFFLFVEDKENLFGPSRPESIPTAYESIPTN